jgi:glycosyltransferase involved in cell wall biosynthesis
MVSVVIPVLNGEKTISGVVDSILTVGQKENLRLEIILVDDASEDGSAAIISRLAEELPQVFALVNGKRYGQQETLLTGLAAAQGDMLVTMDDDAQHDPEGIPSLLNELEAGYDLVYGICQSLRTGYHRTVGSRMRDALFLHLYPVLGSNKVGSFRAFSRELHTDAMRNQKQFSYISCLHLGQRPRVSNVNMECRVSGRVRSNYNILSLFCLLLRIYWYYGPGIKFNIKGDNT